MSNLIYFKVDSTGANVATDRVLYISALKVEGDVRTKFDRYVLPRGEWSIPKETTEINGITEEFIRENGEDPVEVFTDFNDFISSPKGFDLVTFNGLNFDVRILGLEYARLGMAFAATYHRMFDLYDIEARNNRNDFHSTYSRHIGIDSETLGGKPKKTPETLEKLFWRMSDDYTADEILGDYKPVILDLYNVYKANKDGELVFVRGKYTGEKVYDVILKDPNYIVFLFKDIVSAESKKIIINEYESKKKANEL